LQLFEWGVTDFTDAGGVGCTVGRLDFGSEFFDHSKVNQYGHLVVLPPDDIVWGDVAVNDAAGVDVGEDGQHLPDEYQDFGFGETATGCCAIGQQFAVSHPFYVILY
jgi:hypothetical protein